MIETTTAQTAEAADTVQIIDVREDFEVADGMIPGARHIPMGQIPGRLDEIDKSRPVHVVCRSGNRSGRVAEALGQLGYDVVSVAGGMMQWQAEGRPLVFPA
ncbi:rhodanese-like domain-containing protein [Sinomonas sp. ASV486]|uniref:rhodanese-like domain-containing protein n=1 Tax=Sinomonas sp. ASV486 TaxID=3051170 RepID=UPI0027DDCA17|nr:rhodanese-like domain-containing protein [Sinomonas sp. ASV486]MDQ4491183.1 rhodanese-like domain-containing protein [Sinomonas sp. ASV486]MDQ4491843.1 rhodanese-like domain-containing protein [Sinomonas sp. ASV486]MDQ4491989.1 rhodanese-like domain-containing protein [Sinomonas sp. ASV486]